MSDRPAETTVKADNEEEDEIRKRAETVPATAMASVETALEPKLSKNALKRLRRRQEWEDKLDDRRQRRREKRHESRIRKKEEKAILRAQGITPPERRISTLVPIALVLDCDFEQYMTEKEMTSLSSQVTRCYSENKNALWRSHLFIGGFQGKLKERFTGPMVNMHENWTGIEFCGGGVDECAALARQRMEEQGGQMIPALEKKKNVTKEETVGIAQDGPQVESDSQSVVDAGISPATAFENVVYLTSDSPHTLQRLEPNMTYIIGGLVDKNREKGICYRRASAKGIKTAKLPIGEFMQMQARHVLATNHVVEIMLKWLEFEDWGKAFMAVIPKRKGGTLLKTDNAAEVGEDDNEAGREEQDSENVLDRETTCEEAVEREDVSKAEKEEQEQIPR